MIRIGFVLLSNSNRPIPSTRVSVLNMLPFLRAAGFDPQIVFEPANSTETPELSDLATMLVEQDFRIVYFQKIHGPSVEALINRLRASGIKTVYGVCDLVDTNMAALTDATIVVTDYLKSLYPAALQGKIHVVHDGIENPHPQKKSWRDDCGSSRTPLRAVLVTSSALDHLPLLDRPPPWLKVTIVGDYPPHDQRLQRIRQARWRLLGQRNLRDRLAHLRFLADRRIDCQAWHPVEVYEEMCRADIGIIPIDTRTDRQSDGAPPPWKVKSENRLTMKMCVGLPVIATPIPAYEPIIEQGRNGFLAASRRDWLDSLEALRTPSLRQTIGARARETVIRQFSMEEQARRLIEVLSTLAAPSD